MAPKRIGMVRGRLCFVLHVNTCCQSYVLLYLPRSNSSATPNAAALPSGNPIDLRLAALWPRTQAQLSTATQGWPNHQPPLVGIWDFGFLKNLRKMKVPKSF